MSRLHSSSGLLHLSYFGFILFSVFLCLCNLYGVAGSSADSIRLSGIEYRLDQFKSFQKIIDNNDENSESAYHDLSKSQYHFVVFEIIVFNHSGKPLVINMAEVQLFSGSYRIPYSTENIVLRDKKKILDLIFIVSDTVITEGIILPGNVAFYTLDREK